MVKRVNTIHVKRDQEPPDYIERYGGPDEASLGDMVQRGRPDRRFMSQPPAAERPLPAPPVVPQQGPTPSDVDIGEGTDGDIENGQEQAWMAEMLRKILQSGMVDPEMMQAGPGSAPVMPIEQAGPDELGQLLDPTPMERQRRR